MRRVAKEGSRNSKSRASLITGIPRSEVTRILRAADSQTRPRVGQHPARKVLAAWYESPRFLSSTGDPAVLPIFGKRQSFEQLVYAYGSGIPVRAMLDELTKLNAIERLPNQQVKANTRMPIQTGLSANAIAAIGDRGRDLLETLVYNIRNVRHPMFEITASIADAEMEKIPLLRREIANQGASFISAASSILNRSRAKRPKTNASSPKRVGVTVFYFDDLSSTLTDASVVDYPMRRTNLRRKVHHSKSRKSVDQRKISNLLKKEKQ